MLDLAYSILSSDSTVTDICSDRIYPEYREPGTDVPAVMMDLTSMSTLDTMSTTSKADSFNIQLWCFHKGVGAAVSFGRTVRAAIDGQRGTFVMPDGHTYYLASTMVDDMDVDTDFDGRTAAVVFTISMDIITEAQALGPAPVAPTPDLNLNDLLDVDTTGVLNGQVIQFDSASGDWIPGTGSEASFALEDLTNVDTTGVTNGQVIKYNSTLGEWENADDDNTVSGVLSDLSDVDTTGVTDGQILKYETASGEWLPADESGATSELSDLSDVDTTGVTDGQVLKYDTTSGEWLPGDESGGTNQPQDFYYISQKSDLPAPSSGVITLEDNTTYYFTGTVDLTGDRLLSGANSVILGPSSENARITSTGLLAGTALLTSEYTIPIRHVTFQDVDTALYLDGNVNPPLALDWTGVNFLNVPHVGEVNTCDNLIFTKGAFLNSQDLQFTGTNGTISFDNSIFVGQGSAGNIIELTNTSTVTRRFRTVYSSFVVFGSTSGIDVDNSATIPTEGFILDTVNFSAGGTYLAGVDDASNSSRFTNCKGITNTSVNGQYYWKSNTTATTVAATSTFYKVEGTSTASPDNAKFTMTDNRLTCDATIPRKFLIQANLSFESNSSNVCEFGFYDSTFGGTGGMRTPSLTRSTAPSGGRAENVSFMCVTTMEDNDYIEIHCANNTATNDITVTDINVVITEIQ